MKLGSRVETPHGMGRITTIMKGQTVNVIWVYVYLDNGKIEVYDSVKIKVEEVEEVGNV